MHTIVQFSVTGEILLGNSITGDFKTPEIANIPSLLSLIGYAENEGFDLDDNQLSDILEYYNDWYQECCEDYGELNSKGESFLTDRIPEEVLNHFYSLPASARNYLRKNFGYHNIPEPENCGCDDEECFEEEVKNEDNPLNDIVSSIQHRINELKNTLKKFEKYKSQINDDEDDSIIGINNEIKKINDDIESMNDLKTKLLSKVKSKE